MRTLFSRICAMGGVDSLKGVCVGECIGEYNRGY